MAGDPQEFHDDDFPEEEDSGKVWKWEIWPHPYTNDFDYMATDSDDEARDAILHAAEMHLWDSNDGGERTLKVVHNALGEGRERGILREASSGEAATSTDGLGGKGRSDAD